MMTHYVKEEDLQHQAASNAMFQRLCLSMTPEVARAFGHEHSPTAMLEQRLREAVGSRNWPLVGEIEEAGQAGSSGLRPPATPPGGRFTRGFGVAGGVDSGVAFTPAVPGLAPGAFMG